MPFEHIGWFDKSVNGHFIFILGLVAIFFGLRRYKNKIFLDRIVVMYLLLIYKTQEQHQKMLMVFWKIHLNCVAPKWGYFGERGREVAIADFGTLPITARFRENFQD